MKEIANEKFSDFWYEAVVGSSMWAYLSHYLFVTLSATWVLRPLGLSYEIGTLCNFAITQLLIGLTFQALSGVQRLARR